MCEYPYDTRLAAAITDFYWYFENARTERIDADTKTIRGHVICIECILKYTSTIINSITKKKKLLLKKKKK